jgi:uncharacterized iron-regulated protein
VHFSASRLFTSSIVILLGCGARVEPDPAERSVHAERTHEGRAGQLLRLAHDVGAMTKHRRHEADSWPLPTTPPEAATPEGPPASGLDAGAPASGEQSEIDAGGGGGGGEEEVGDAAPPPSPPPPSPPPPSPPRPEPLPRDIVAQSALPIYGLEAGVVLSEVELWDRLATSPAVCFGEYHDLPAHHYAETRALGELAARAAAAGNTFAVGFEMFQRPYQAPLSAFVAGELGEDEFLAQTEYYTRWGYDYALYRPLLEGARDHHLPALALNMRREITRKIGRTGIESLDASELAELPELDLQDEEHRAFIFGLFGVLPEHAAELGLENIYTAQTVWDETMADTSARWLGETGSSARLLDFAGGVHCHRSAIPRRIMRRTPSHPALSVHAVFASELADGSFTPEGYDVLVVLDDGAPL